MLRIALINFCFVFPLLAFAQEPENKGDSTAILLADSTQIDKNVKVIDIETYAKRYNPRKAILYSAVVPGMGQAYNGKYWKMPIVYGGFIAGFYVIDAYQGFYSTYRSQLFTILDEKAQIPAPTTTPVSPDGYNEDQLRSLINRYRRQRDYFIVLTALWYALQMIDAHVDAHLKEFDLNPKLKVSLVPSTNYDMMTGQTTGASLTIKF